MSEVAIPNEPAIRSQMELLVKKVDLETITRKQFIKLLSAEMGGANLSSKKAYIKSTLTEVLDAMDDDNDDEDKTDDEETEDESDDDDDEKRKKTEAKPKTTRKGTGLTVVKEISDDLAVFLGKGKQMARTEVVKGLWAYIKANNLQNPEDRREIILDDKMKILFKVDKFTMFTLNKYVVSHIHPFTPVNLEELSENSKKRKEEAARKRKAKIEAKKGKKKKMRRRREGSHPPYRLSDDLQAVVCKEILPRPQVTQALWIYIKKHNLQSDTDKRIIVCDDLLKPIMGGNETGKYI
jgi:upstream activation factor subunit UAF30